MTFCHDNHVKVSIWHEWEVRTVSLLGTPSAAYEGVPDDHVHVAAHAQPDVAVESDVNSVIRTALKIYCESENLYIGITLHGKLRTFQIFTEIDRNHNRNSCNFDVFSVKSVVNKKWYSPSHIVQITICWNFSMNTAKKYLKHSQIQS